MTERGSRPRRNIRLLGAIAPLVCAAGLLMAAPAPAGIIPPVPDPLNRAPQAGFKISCTNLRCEFRDRSTDSDGTIRSWAWTFGDGGSASLQNPDHTYLGAGTYRVSLEVTDDDGAKSSAAADITVSKPPDPGNIAPLPRFGSSCEYLRCSFTDRSLDPDGEVASLLWNFGDGTISSENHPDHRYSGNGQYAVSLRVIDDLGAQSSITKQLTVTERDPSTLTRKLENRRTAEWTSHRAEQWRFFRFGVPAKRPYLQVRLWKCGVECGAELDLYLRRNKHPNLVAFDCRSSRDGSFEQCRVERPHRGSWKIGVYNSAGERGAPFKIRAKHRG